MSEPTMSPQAREAVASLNELAMRLSLRAPVVQRRLAYYAGQHPLRFASPEFRDYFAQRFEGFADNWCAPVVDAPTERMNVLGVRIGPPPSREIADGDGEDDASLREVDADLARVWEESNGARGSSESFVTALSGGWAYAMVWGDPEDADEQTPLINWERPDQAIIDYDPDTHRAVRSLKLWRDEKNEYATLADGDHLWKFFRPSYVIDGRTRSGLVVPASAVGGWQPRQSRFDDTWPLPNPLGRPPMVELKNRTLLDDNPMSDIAGVIAMQDGINLVWAYLFNALDYASLPQRVVMGTDIPQLPVLDENGQVVGKRPLDLDTLIRDRVLWIPGKDAKIDDWPAANLDAYSQVIERAIEHIAAQTRTPPHYLIGKVANLSAEALSAAETGLVAKTGERITYFNPAIRDVFALVALAQGNPAKARAVRSGTVIWKDTQFRALGQKVDALMKMKGIGFPFEWIAEQYGLTPPEVARVMRMRDREAQADPLAEIGRQLGSGQSAPEPEATPRPDEPVPVSAGVGGG